MSFKLSKLWLLFLFCSTLVISGCGKKEEPVGEVLPTPEAMTIEPATSDLVDAAIKKFDDAKQDFMVSFHEAESEEAKEELIAEKYPKADDFAAPLLKIAEENPLDEAAVTSLLWVAKNTSGDDSLFAIEKLTTDYLDRPELQELCMPLSFKSSEAAPYTALEKLMNESLDQNVNGTATFAMAKFLIRSKANLTRLEESASDSAEATAAKEFLSSLDLSESRIRSLYEKAATYADVRPYRTTKRKLKELAEGALFEMDNLKVGQEAPDIEAEDLEGEDFKLSDYRGKVVVIDFWGDW